MQASTITTLEATSHDSRDMNLDTFQPDSPLCHTLSSSPALPPPQPCRRLRINTAPTCLIRTRPHYRLTLYILKARTCNHTTHNPCTPRHMRRHARRRTHTHTRRARPCAAPHRRARDNVVGYAGRGRCFCEASFGGAVYLLVISKC